MVYVDRHGKPINWSNRLRVGKLYKAKDRNLRLFSPLGPTSPDSWLPQGGVFMLVTTSLDIDTHGKAGLSGFPKHYVLILWDEQTWVVERVAIEPLEEE